MKKLLPLAIAVLAAVTITTTSTPAHASIWSILAGIFTGSPGLFAAGVANSASSNSSSSSSPTYAGFSERYCAYQYLKGFKWKCRYKTADIEIMPVSASDYTVTIKEQSTASVSDDAPLVDDTSSSPLRSFKFEITGPGFTDAALEGRNTRKFIQMWNDEDQQWQDVTDGYGGKKFSFWANVATAVASKDTETDVEDGELKMDFGLEGNIDKMKNIKVRAGVFYEGSRWDVSSVGTRRVKRKRYYIFTPELSVADCFDPTYFADENFTLTHAQVCGEPADADADGITDADDNCLDVANPEQEDLDADGFGDACDESDDRTDVDEDGLFDIEDNCPDVANPEQEDIDADGVGDVCDEFDDRPDYDEDGILNEEDNCPQVANPDQLDTDEDGIGDVCNGDADEDGILDGEDNCLDVVNPEQEDVDADGVGDACDETDDRTDVDEDGILDEEDNCPAMHNVEQEDLDVDGIGDACDDDVDGDEILDVDDNCPLDVNPEQEDLDDDGLGDVCDDIDDTLNRNADPDLSAWADGGCSLNPQATANVAPLWMALIAALSLVAIRRRK